MKKAMLNRVEGLGGKSEVKEPKPEKNLLIDDNDRREEMLYRSMDNIIDTQTGGGDILNANSSVEVKNSHSHQSQLRRNSELNHYSDIAISDQKDAYGNQKRVTNLDIQAIR